MQYINFAAPTTHMDSGLSTFMQTLRLAPATLEGKEEISPGVFILHIAYHTRFLPGQVVGLSLAGLPPRLYSIASGIDDNGIELLFNVNPEGELTPRLAALMPGDTLNISAPFGAFLGDDKPAWWIAAGTGIAPYRAMLRSGLGQNKVLIHGGRTADSFYFQQEMSQAFGSRYVRCCSQETGEGLYSGRLTKWLEEQAGFDPALQYYLCGSAEMVVEVRDILIGGGVPFERIMSEIYF